MPKWAQKISNTGKMCCFDMVFAGYKDCHLENQQSLLNAPQFSLMNGLAFRQTSFIVIKTLVFVSSTFTVYCSKLQTVKSEKITQIVLTCCLWIHINRTTKETVGFGTQSARHWLHFRWVQFPWLLPFYKPKSKPQETVAWSFIPPKLSHLSYFH